MTLEKLSIIVPIFISICSLIISIIVMLWGNNILGRVDTIEEKTKNVESTVLALKVEVAASNAAPSTEKVTKKPTSDESTVDLSPFNITLSDRPDQEDQVREWLRNPYSGYPALIEAILTVMQGHSLKGNAVPLTIINAKNLKIHGRQTSEPFNSLGEIDLKKLKEAIYLSWREKNSGSKLNNFEQIIE